MLLTRFTDFVYAVRIMRILQKPWEKQKAFELGIIDDKGNSLKKWSDLRTAEERDNFTPLIRIVFNLKRILQRVPGMEKDLIRLAATLRLLKEESDFYGINLPEKTCNRLLEMLYTGDMSEINEDTPTNVVGDGTPMSTDNPKRLGKKIIKRAPLEDLDEFIDPMSAVIVGISTLIAIPAAKGIMKVLEPVISYLKSNNQDASKKKELLKKIKLARSMAEKASDDEKRKLLAWISKLEKEL